MDHEHPSASPIRHQRGRGVAAVAVGILILSGCAGQRDPTSYTASVEREFTSACWTTTVLDQARVDLKAGTSSKAREARANRVGSKAQITAAKSSCGCAFDRIKKNVKFSQFKAVNDDLREDPGPLPASFAKAFAACGDATSS